MLSSRRVGLHQWDRSCCLQKWFLLWICRTTPRVWFELYESDVWYQTYVCEIAHDRMIGSYACLLQMFQEICAHGWLRSHHGLPAGLAWKTADVEYEIVWIWVWRSVEVMIVSMVHHELAHLAQSGLWDFDQYKVHPFSRSVQSHVICYYRIATPRPN